ncbi:MAG: TSUP family transporter [Arenicellales bacterium]
MEPLSIELITLLLLTGVFAGTLDSIAGGGGLIAFPILLSTGINPLQALATNKLQGSFGTTTAALHFLRHGEIDHEGMIFAIVCTFVGAMLGALAVSHIDSRLLMTFIPVLLIANALYFLFSPRVGDVERHRRISMGTFSVIFGAGLGFYDGFFGPGTGAFFALAFVTMLGFSLKQATAHSKVLNMTSNLAALLFFILGGHVVWSIGLVMGAGQVIGASIGAHLVIKRGTALIRPLLVIVSIALTVKLVVADPANPIRHLIGY